MSSADRVRSLSWGDTSFLYLERDGHPLNIASACQFEGKISLQACARFVESKLHLIPRYKQRAVFPPFNIGLPTWERLKTPRGTAYFGRRLPALAAAPESGDSFGGREYSISVFAAKA
jgi:hypothetical protein